MNEKLKSRQNIKYNYHEKITYLVASIPLMGGGFANATEKITCLVREDCC
jgi:hypothetical protein